MRLATEDKGTYSREVVSTSSPPCIDPAVFFWIFSAFPSTASLVVVTGGTLMYLVYRARLGCKLGSRSEASDWAVATPLCIFPNDTSYCTLARTISCNCPLSMQAVPFGLAARSSPTRVLGTMIQAPQRTSLPHPITSVLTAPGILSISTTWLGYKRSRR